MFKFFDIDDVITNPISPENSNSPKMIGIFFVIILFIVFVVSVYRWVQAKKNSKK